MVVAPGELGLGSTAEHREQDGGTMTRRTLSLRARIAGSFLAVLALSAMRFGAPDAWAYSKPVGDDPSAAAVTVSLPSWGTSTLIRELPKGDLVPPRRRLDRA